MNKQSNLFEEVSVEKIREIFRSCLKEQQIQTAQLMSGGLFNTTYYVEYGAAYKKAILRLGPVNRHLLMGFEDNLMEAEEYVYSICKKIGIPCSNVLACDTSKQIIDRDFMIVEYIPSIVMVNAELTDEKRNQLYFQMGKQIAKFHSVTGEHFGFVSRLYKGKTFSKWSDALIFETKDIAGRLEHQGGLSKKETETLCQIFDQNREVLDRVKTPHLLHTDVWEGNILLDRDTLNISAVIDSDRAVFGDVDFEFASSWMGNPMLKKGYDSIRQENQVSPFGREKRICLYRMFYALLEAYVGYAEYNNWELYEARKKQLLESMEKCVGGRYD